MLEHWFVRTLHGAQRSSREQIESHRDRNRIAREPKQKRLADSSKHSRFAWPQRDSLEENLCAEILECRLRKVVHAHRHATRSNQHVAAFDGGSHFLFQFVTIVTG